MFGTRVRVDSVAKVAEMETAEREKMRDKVRMQTLYICLLQIKNLQVKKICDHGINVFINRQLIYNYPEQLFAGEF